MESLAHTDTGSGPPVVLLHGLTCHLGYWQRVAPLLEGVRVVALDFGGHGLSGHRESYGYADYERDLATVLDELELEGVTVAGHSLGGYVALLAAARRADHAGGRDGREDRLDAGGRRARRTLP